MKKPTLVLVLFGCAAIHAPTSLASDFQSAMPSSLRSSIQQPAVNTPNANVQTNLQAPLAPGSTPLSTSPPLPLRGMTGNQSPVNPSPAGSQDLGNAPPVSSFFKLSGTAGSLSRSAAPAANSLPSQNTLNSVVQKNGSGPVSSEKTAPDPKDFSPGKLIWHVLDNMGVPLFVGKDNDLAPGLQRAQGMPDKAYFLSDQTKISDKSIGSKPKRFQFKPKRIEQTPVDSNSATSLDSKANDEKPRSPLEKIPQSELEGVSPTDSTDNDAKKTKP